MQQIWFGLAIAFGLFGAGVATAQTNAPIPGPRRGDLPLIISLDASDCRRLLAQADSAQLAHRPDAGVTYRPGRDVDPSGRPIAPADLPGSNQTLLTGPLELPVNITLSDLLGGRTPPRLGVSELNVVRVGIDPVNGRVTFNGQPLDRRGEDAVITACREYLAGQGRPR